MKKEEKIPLEQRLQMAGAFTPDLLVVFRISVEDYLLGVTQLTGKSCFGKNLQREIDEKCAIEFERTALASMPCMTDSLTTEEGTKLLYKMLIEPFAWMQEQKKEEHLHESLHKNP